MKWRRSSVNFSSRVHIEMHRDNEAFLCVAATGFRDESKSLRSTSTPSRARKIGVRATTSLQRSRFRYLANIRESLGETVSAALGIDSILV